MMRCPPLCDRRLREVERVRRVAILEEEKNCQMGD